MKGAVLLYFMNKENANAYSMLKNKRVEPFIFKTELKMHFFYLVYLVHRFGQTPSPSLKNSHTDLAQFLLARTKPKRCVPCRFHMTFFQQYDQAGTFCRNHGTGQVSCYLHVYSNKFFLKKVKTVIFSRWNRNSGLSDVFFSFIITF